MQSLRVVPGLPYGVRLSTQWLTARSAVAPDTCAPGRGDGPVGNGCRDRLRGPGPSHSDGPPPPMASPRPPTGRRANNGPDPAPRGPPPRRPDNPGPERLRLAGSGDQPWHPRCPAPGLADRMKICSRASYVPDVAQPRLLTIRRLSMGGHCRTMRTEWMHAVSFTRGRARSCTGRRARRFARCVIVSTA